MNNAVFFKFIFPKFHQARLSKKIPSPLPASLHAAVETTNLLEQISDEPAKKSATALWVTL